MEKPTKGHPTIELKGKILKAQQSGSSVLALAIKYGISRQSIYRWISTDAKKESLARKVGSGKKALISNKNAIKLFAILKNPATKYNYKSELWTPKRIREICQSELKLKISKMSVWRAVSKLENSFKETQNSFNIASNNKTNWKKDTLPRITNVTSEHRAIMYFVAESIVPLLPFIDEPNDSNNKKPGKEIQSAEEDNLSLCALSGISSDGRVAFNLFESNKRFNAQDIVNFLTQLLAHHPHRHLVVILDQSHSHNSKFITDIAIEKKRLHVFYLPE